MSTKSSPTSTRHPGLWVPTVYFAMGLPMVLLSDVSILMFGDLGIPDKQIAFWASLLTLPWSLKPLFSPIMELVGTKKQYVVLSELLSALMLGLVFVGLGLDNFFAITLLLMAILAISGSVHDIAGDGTYMHFLSSKEQSEYIGWQGAFYNIAKVLAKGGLVYLVGVLTKSYGLVGSWRFIFVLASVLLLSISVYHFFVLPGEMRSAQASTERQHRSLKESMKELWEIIVSFFKKKYILYYLLFILLYRLTEGLTIKIAPLFLKASADIGGLGLSNEQFGLIYGTFGTLAFIIGSILSGYFISHYGLRKVLFVLALIFNIPFIVFFLLAYFQPSSMTWITLGIIFENFGYGFGFVGLNLFMMQQVAPGPHQMAHYAFGTSIMNLSVMLPGMVSGALSDALGYKIFFLVAVLVAIPGILCAYFVPFTYDSKGNKIETN
ncbi:MAG: MFS transporter [Porphyromonas sp.]|nr:MFS transporter [Porphyromonas sp.]